MLRDNFVPRARTIFGGDFDFIFQQDNAPAHKAKDTIAFFDDNNIRLLSFPSGSPDLNPIENIWSILKSNVAQRFPKKTDELERFAIEEWRKIPQKVIENAIDSMTTRISQVIGRNGKKCDY